MVMDKVSVSDYLAAYAFIILKECNGPNILNEIYYGRKDVADPL